MLVALGVVASQAPGFLPKGAGYVTVLATILLFVGGLRVYAAARRRLAVLQRDAAVRIAGDGLRKVLIGPDGGSESVPTAGSWT